MDVRKALIVEEGGNEALSNIFSLETVGIELIMEQTLLREHIQSQLQNQYNCQSLKTTALPISRQLSLKIQDLLMAIGDNAGNITTTVKTSRKTTKPRACITSILGVIDKDGVMDIDRVNKIKHMSIYSNHNKIYSLAHVNALSSILGEHYDHMMKHDCIVVYFH